MSFQKQQQELVGKVIAGLCGITEYPDGLFPHTVFVEEEGNDGNPVYNRYRLVSIGRSNATCILEHPVTGRCEEYNLDEIATDWLITVWSRCRDLMFGQGMWRETKPAIPHGLWAFLYPLEYFDRDAGDDVILAAHLHEDNRYLDFPVERMTPAEFANMVNSENFADQEYWVRMIEVTEQNQPLLKYRSLTVEDFRGIVDDEVLETISDDDNDEISPIETKYNDKVMKAYREKSYDGTLSSDDMAAGSIVAEFLSKAVSEVL